MKEISLDGIVVECLIKKSDKRGEYAYLRIKHANNEIVWRTEKYKNVSFAKSMAAAYAMHLKAKLKIEDGRKR